MSVQRPGASDGRHAGMCAVKTQAAAAADSHTLVQVLPRPAARRAASSPWSLLAAAVSRSSVLCVSAAVTQSPTNTAAPVQLHCEQQYTGPDGRSKDPPLTAQTLLLRVLLSVVTQPHLCSGQDDGVRLIGRCAHTHTHAASGLTRPLSLLQGNWRPTSVVLCSAFSCADAGTLTQVSGPAACLT